MRGPLHWLFDNAFLIGLISLAWLALRTGTKPSRAAYPCQQAAAASGYLWLAIYVLPLVLAVRKKAPPLPGVRKHLIALIVLAVVVSATWGVSEMNGSSHSPASASQAVGLTLASRTAEVKPASDIFVVNGTFGNDGGVAELIKLMADKGSLFYRSPTAGTNKGPTGLIARDDVVIIKVNSQWDERGGTNTDLLKALIQAIVKHPDGFVGEVIAADNGQAQYGPSGSGGSLDYSRNNAEDTSQSVQKVVDSFAASSSYRVSTYLWDTITTRRVKEYGEGDTDDGYVVSTAPNPRTGMLVSYPKFKAKSGTNISFKLGIWEPQTQTYASDRLKVINVPVLKSHRIYGVTASVKHYMGVVSDKLTAQLGARAHSTIGAGGLGTEMVETRFPALNIIDAIWVNANPSGGPSTPYANATRVNVIAASTDPIALDCWAAKQILIPAARSSGFSNVASIDPDNTAPNSFGQWLRLSMEEMNRAGYQTTVDEARLNVYVVQLPPATPATSTTSAPPSPGIPWPYIIGAVVVALGATAGVIALRRKRRGQQA